MNFPTRKVLRAIPIAALCLSLSACGTFHPEPYAMFADHPDYDPDNVAIVSISPVAENEYTVLSGYTSFVSIARAGDSSWRSSERSWWISLAPGDYVISIPAPELRTSTMVPVEPAPGVEGRPEEMEVIDRVFLEIPVTVEAGKKYRLVRARVSGILAFELREMEYIGDIFNRPR